jgi:hypothetical protein
MVTTKYYMHLTRIKMCTILINGFAIGDIWPILPTTL